MLITVSHINLSFGLHFYFSSSHCVLSGGKKTKEVGFVFYVNPVCQVWMGSLSKTQQ